MRLSVGGLADLDVVVLPADVGVALVGGVL